MSQLSNIQLFRDLVPNFGRNIALDAIQTHIDDAAEYLEGVIPLPLISALEIAASDIKAIPLYSEAISYSEGDKTRVGKVVYRAGATPGMLPTGWTRLELYDLLSGYIEPLVTFKAAARFFIFHGLNVNQFGMSQTSGAEFTNISDKARGMASGDMERKAKRAQSMLETYLTSKNNTFDGVSYAAVTPKPKPNFGITSIKKQWP